MHLSKTVSCCFTPPPSHHESAWQKDETTFDQRHQSQMIERALAAFFQAVAKEYGLEEAARAAQDWIEEFQRAGAVAPIDWRSITTTAASHLARRVAAVAQL